MMEYLMPHIRNVADLVDADTFIDVFGGGGSCTVNARICGHTFERIIYNELNTSVASLMAALSNKETADVWYKTIKDIDINTTDFSAAKLRRNFLNTSEISMKEAVDFTITNLCSRNVRGRDYSTERAALMNNVVKRLYSMQHYVDGVYVQNKNAFDIIDDWGTDPKVLKYIDPPYFPLTRNKTAQRVYKYDWTREDHQRLVRKLVNCRCWILSGYDPAEQGYDDYLPLEEAGAKKVLLKRVALPSSNTIAGKESTKKNEYIWIKY